MGVKIKVDTLSSFLNKLEKAKQLDTLCDKIASEVANKGKRMAEDKYSDSNVSRANVIVDKISDKNYSIIASGEGLSFEEYGTGYPGLYSNYPKDKLPTDTITFESAGRQRSTQGWDYYYDNPDTKVTIDGKKGWFLGDNFVEGQEAGKQMYETSVDLRNETIQIAKQIIKEFIQDE